MASKKEMLRVDLEARWQILIIAKEVLKFAHYFDTPVSKGGEYKTLKLDEITLKNGRPDLIY